MNRPLFALLLVLPLVPACSPAAPRVADGAPQAVVLVTIDTLRGDSVSYAGAAENRTPFLDRLAQEGIAYRNAYAPTSWTGPSMASLFTGVYPSTHGIDTALFFDRVQDEVRHHALPAELPTIAKSMRDAGYLTVGVPSNRNLTAALGFGQGFDHYVDKAPFLEAFEVNARVRQKMIEAFGKDWRSTWKEQKTFLWIHYFDPHMPYLAREPSVHEYAPDLRENPDRYPAGANAPELRARYPGLPPELAEVLTPLYASEVRHVDDHLAQIAGELGLPDPEVLILVTADHGEEFLEHRHLSHGSSIYQEVVHVPMVACWPEHLPAGLVVETSVNLLDVYPSLLEWCGIDPPSSLQGISFAQATRGGDRSLPLIFEQKAGLQQAWLIGILSGKWKLITRTDGAEAPRLFDLASDPTEQTDVAAAHPELVAELQALLTAYRDRLPPPSHPGASWTVDPELARQLEALGYAGD